MIGADTVLAIGVIALAALVIASLFALKGWQGWLEIRKMEIAHSGHPETATQVTGGRIEIADLKERVRKLEQIASGIDL
jgi:hypothetical protein